MVQWRPSKEAELPGLTWRGPETHRLILKQNSRQITEHKLVSWTMPTITYVPVCDKGTHWDGILLNVGENFVQNSSFMYHTGNELRGPAAHSTTAWSIYMRHGNFFLSPISLDLKRGNPYFLTSSPVGWSSAAHKDTSLPWNNRQCWLILRLVNKRGHDWVRCGNTVNHLEVVAEILWLTCL